MIRIGLLGFGYWGPNLARNIVADLNTELAAVCDTDPERLAETARLYPGVRVTTDPSEIIRDPTIAAIVIATPLASHFELGMASLRAGKHLFVEKPLASTSVEALSLRDAAERGNLVLMVDHTFIYTDAVTKLRMLVNSPDFGQPRYFDSTRINLGLFRQDLNVVWDLAVHDISILDYVIDARPVAVSATGHAHLPKFAESTAYLTFFFEGNFIAHVNVSWLSPVKFRRTIVAGSRQTVVYNDLEASEKLKVYDNRVDLAPSVGDSHQLLVSYRTGDLWSPKLDDVEALRRAISHFTACIDGKEAPLTGANEGLRLVLLLEAVNKSMRQKGAPVELPDLM